MPCSRSAGVIRRGRTSLAGLACALIGLADGQTASAQDERRVPAPRLEPGLVLERGADHGPPLEPIGAGRLRHRDPRFTAIIEADGSVEFRDVVIKPEANLLGVDLIKRKLDPPRPLARDSFAERAMFPFGPSTAPMMVSMGGGGGGLLGALIGLMRRNSAARDNDNKRPSRANLAAKAAFLAETEAVRMRMAHAWLKQRLAEQQAALVEQVLAVWRDPSLPLAARRRQIFTLWDECAEPTESQTAVDEIRAQAALAARGRVEALIRMLAPQGSPRQFTADELASFNARRRSRTRFDPYMNGEP